MQLQIGAIHVGDRRREDMGDLDGLAESIQRYGLLHPVVVDADMNLVAGGRRLAACKNLGWTEVLVRMLDTLTEAERREIELEENLRRKDLTAYERSKAMVELIETAREVAKEQTRSDSEHVSKPLRGPSKIPGSYRDIEQRTGIAPATAIDVQQHVATADAYPVMQRPEWKQYHVLEAKERLEQLPEAERPAAVALVSQPGVPPKEAIGMLATLAAMPKPDRAEVFRLNDSDNRQDNHLALTRAAQKPPMPDPRLLSLQEAMDALKRAAKQFPGKAETPRLVEIIHELAQMVESIREEYRCLKMAEQARFESYSVDTAG